MAEPSLLGVKASDLLKDQRNEVLFSIVSVWELLIKARTGKLRVDHRELVAGASVTGFSLIGVELEYLDSLARLTSHHGDPFDHLLIAQAIAEGAVFMSNDRMAARYPLKVVSAGD